MNRSLSVKLTLVILFVTLIGVFLVAIFARLATAREFDRFLLEQLRDDFVTEVTSYYQRNGSWADIVQALPPPRQPRPPQQDASFDTDQRPPRGESPPNPPLFVLLDTEGCVIVPARRRREEGCPQLPKSNNRKRDYQEIKLGQEVIGTVVTIGNMPDRIPRESNYLERMNLAILWGALGAGVIAVILGSVVAGTLIRPLRRLTVAIRAVAAGDLQQQVQVHPRDELGELATAFNQMSADLNKANQARRQMTADIAHELRNPLMVMTGYIEAMRDGVLAPTPERLGAMQDEAEHLKRLVADLRTLSLADAGELRLHKEEVLVDDLLLRVATNYQSQAQESAVHLDVDVPFALPTIQVDPERMVQVLNNLVSNALRYTPTNGRIVLAAQATVNQILLSVQDSGAGIAPEALAHIFDRFYRADPSRESSSSSESGLGLAIAKSIVIAHQGTIDVASTLGQGTTFTIQLPRA